MDRKEKLQAVLNGEIIDGCLSGFWMHFPKFCQHGRASIEAHKKFFAATNVDILKVMNEYLYQIDFDIHRPSDWKKLKPIVPKDSFFEEYLDLIRALRSEMGNNVPLFATIHGILVSACHATDGPNRFVDPNNLVTRHLKEDPESVVIGLKVIASSLEELGLACIKAGADGIYYAALGGEEHRFEEIFFNQYVKPLERKLLGSIKQYGHVILHICKDHIRLPMYSDYPADVVNWAVHGCSYSLADGRKLFPNMTLLGGLDNRSGALIDGNNVEVQREIEEITKSVGFQKFILGADCTLPTTMKYEYIRHAVDIGHRL